MIEISGLRKSFGKNVVFQGLDLTVQKATITAVAGPNACGKTTLIKCILGLVVPNQGEIKVGGRIVEKDWIYRREIGYMPQYPDFPSSLNLKELLRMLEEIRGAKSTRSQELVQYFDLGKIMKQPFGQLSGGTKQKVAALVAFMFDAPIIVLDEPTAGLDPVTSVKFKDLLIRMASEGKSILMVSHIMTEVEQLARDLIYLVDGKLAYSGSVSSLKEKTQVADLERAITHLMEAPL